MRPFRPQSSGVLSHHKEILFHHHNRITARTKGLRPFLNVATAALVLVHSAIGYPVLAYGLSPGLGKSYSKLPLTADD